MCKCSLFKAKLLLPLLRDLGFVVVSAPDIFVDIHQQLGPLAAVLQCRQFGPLCMLRWVCTRTENVGIGYVQLGTCYNVFAHTWPIPRVVGATVTQWVRSRKCI